MLAPTRKTTKTVVIGKHLKLSVKVLSVEGNQVHLDFARINRAAYYEKHCMLNSSQIKILS